MTVAQLITGAFRLLGQLRTGQGASTDALADGLTTLNDMIEAWNNERLMVHAIQRSVFSLTGAASYTIGTGGNFNVTRPVRIDNAGCVLAGGDELELELLTPQRWAEQTLKSLTSTLPQKLYHETTFPLGRIYLWPVPTEANQLALYMWQALAGFAATGDTVSFPPGYAKALRYNLAVELAPQFMLKGKLTPMVAEIANESKAALKRINAVVVEMACDEALVCGGAFDYRTGQ
jgi:hypothetical protein